MKKPANVTLLIAIIAYVSIILMDCFLCPQFLLGKSDFFNLPLFLAIRLGDMPILSISIIISLITVLIARHCLKRRLDIVSIATAVFVWLQLFFSSTLIVISRLVP